MEAIIGFNRLFVDVITMIYALMKRQVSVGV